MAWPISALAIAALLAGNAATAQEVLPAPPPLEAYGQLPGVEDVAISPSGLRIAMVTTVRGQRVLLVVNDANQLLRSVTLGTIKFRGMRFVGDDSLLFFRSETVEVDGFVADQYELMQGILVPVAADGEFQIVFAGRRDMSNAIMGNYGVRRIGDDWRGFFGGVVYERGLGGGYRFDNGNPALFALDFASFDHSRIAEAAPEGYYRDWLIDRDGRIAATYSIARSTGEWRIVNSAQDEIASGRSANGNAGIIGFGADGTSLLFRMEDGETGLSDWFEVPLAGGPAVPFLADVAVERLYWDSASDRLLGYLPDAEDAVAIFYDPELQRRARMVEAAFPNVQARMLEWTDGMGRAIVHTTGNGDSGTWYLVDLATRRADPVGYDRLEIVPEQVGPIRMTEYTASDGLPLDGVLTLPPGREPRGLPLVVLPHGGPHAHDEPRFDWWAQGFASRGYAVFQPNFRGSTGRGEAFERAGYGEWGRKMQTDISDGVAHLAAEGIIDPARACIVGASYGGYAALAGVTVQQGLYRCAVAVAGVSDIGLLYATDRRESGRNGLLIASLREEFGPRDGWPEVSPRRLASRADAPILLIHGRDDTVVPFEQSRVMADALDDAGRPHRLVELEGEDHWLSLSETRLRMLTEAVAFVQEHNPAD